VPQAIPDSTSIGFITSLNQEDAYTGGYLVTNAWGRPLEFRVSTKVAPTRVQRILYGETLEPYVLADVIGKGLLTKTATAVSWIVTDQRAFLALRPEIDVPITWVTNDAVEPRDKSPDVMRAGTSGDYFVYCHENFRADVDSVQSHLASCRLDLLEPFERLASAIQESQRLGTLQDLGAKA
jgi:hypothetical protein